MTRVSCIAIILVLSTASCDFVSPTERDDYPTILTRKSTDEIRSLTSRYRETNPGSCVKVDEFGFNGDSPCTDWNPSHDQLDEQDRARLQAMASRFLFKNRAFTNVYDTTGLQIRRSYPMPESSLQWKITYQNQVVEGLEVLDSQISVFLDAEKVFNVYGNWYREVVVPEVDALDADDARRSLIGRTFTYSDWGGLQTATITRDSFTPFEDRVVVPFETSRGLELRVCLAVEASIWRFYVDSTTGELIHREQTIIF